MKKNGRPNRIIEVRNGIIGPAQPKGRKLKRRTREDYPEIHPYHLVIAEHYSSPLLMGPPLCDELVELVVHMFNEEEASLVRHIKPLGSYTVTELAARERRPVEEIVPILNRLTSEKRLLLKRNGGEKNRYYILPIVPGTFELALIRPSMDLLTPWHVKFAKLFEKLFETGYMLDYSNNPSPVVRYLPVGQSIEAHPMALPSDKLEEVFGRYKDFGVGLCQCRMTEELVGNGCGKDMLNCTVMGPGAIQGIEQGYLKKMTLPDVIEIKKAAEEQGLITWMIMEESGMTTTASCSCCGCCCHMLRTITEYNAPGWIAPPHFVPEFDDEKCTGCGKCARACPMGGIVADTKAKTVTHLIDRCVGCGQCVIACDKEKAITMQDIKGYKAPPDSLRSLLVKSLPGYLKTAWQVYRRYR